MYTRLAQRLKTLETQQLYPHLAGSNIGLEKESLRVTPDSRLAQTPHPKQLGSALTHPWITTDYAESLLELITPPQKKSQDALDFLLDLETFIYQQLDNELLWTASMPCILSGEQDIRIAEYGSSNAGQMKHIYRQGLAWRYGKIMQVIAGIHFNYSISEAFWPAWQQAEGRTDQTLRDFINEQYMALTRNLLRYGWLILYLFGSSPAICKSFLGGRQAPDTMREFNEYTYYEPYGTSLRMGNVGYTNRKENDTGVRVSYNSLAEYVAGLTQAINTPWPAYEAIGIKVDGVYRQLNANLLQIENEYYSTVRPKQPLQGFEKPSYALSQRGIHYIELRSLDINIFEPAGLNTEQLAFLEVFMHFCLLKDSDPLSAEDMDRINYNQNLVAHQGRQPELSLNNYHGDSMKLTEWADSLLTRMLDVAELLDRLPENQGASYRNAVLKQQELVLHPELTPAARMIAEMRANNNEGYFCYAQRKSAEHRHYFMQRHLSNERQNRFIELALESLNQQQIIEKNDRIDFKTFLSRYFDNQL